MSQAATCEQCGAPLPPDARFCPRCGAPVAGGPTEERRVVTALFVDLTGSTELAARLDPERIGEVMAAFFGVASAEVESLRGRVEKFIGDAVMAVFGLPGAHDDDALRAVRAALRIRDRAGRLAEKLSLPVPLRVHAGVNTGPVATGVGPPGQALVSGVAVNLAARLQEAAEPDEVLVGEVTWQLTRDAVEYGPPRTIGAKGFAGEIRGWPVVSLFPKSSRRTIPLVGRRRELALLNDTFDRVRATGRAHLVTLLGEPGIGKTRLLEEFAASVPEETRVLIGRVSRFDEDVTFAPVAQMLRRELGLEPETPAREVRDRLRELAEGCCDPSEADQVAARLGLAVGLGEEHTDGEADEEVAGPVGPVGRKLAPPADGRQGRPHRASEIRSGLIGLLGGLTATGPVVMVVDNLGLAQPGLLDLLVDILSGARRLPLLMIGAARDDLLEQRPAWGGGIPDALTLRLDPLSHDEAKELALAAGSADESTAERVARQAGGNPFFIVETTGMMLHEHPDAAGVEHGHLLPPTVQAVVASRLDRLPEDARELLRRASVLGTTSFDLHDLSLVAGPDPDRQLLQRLEDEEVLVRSDARPDGWRFRHEMLRDVAYESLSKRDRLRLHVQVADGLQAADGERWPQAIAHHLQRAARASLDLDPNDRTLADRAVEALAHAGDLSRRRIESRTAIDLYRRALALAGPEERWGPRESSILSFIGEAYYWLGEYEEAEAALARALRIGQGDAWTTAHAARFLADTFLTVNMDLDRAGALFGQALRAARELRDPWTLARTLLMAGWEPYWRGDLERTREMFEEALRVARDNPETDRWAEARAVSSLASVASAAGDERDALALSGEALALGQAMDDPFTIAVGEEKVGDSLRRMWRLEESLAHFDRAVRTFREIDARWELASAAGGRGHVRLLLDRLQDAEKDLREAIELCRKIGDRSMLSSAAELLVRVLLRKGDLDGARALLEDESLWPGAEGPANLTVAQAATALAAGDREQAREAGLRALAIERAAGWRNSVAARTWWVGRLFGAEAVGGEQVLEEARRTLEAAHWVQPLRETESLLQESTA